MTEAMTVEEERHAERLAEAHKSLTYRYGGENSYFGDVYRWERHANRESFERLQRHAEELERAPRARRIAEGVEFEVRTPPSWTPGYGGYFAPPAWLNEFFATYPRPERVLARLAPNFHLPMGVQSVNLPVLTTGTLSGGEPLDDASPDSAIVDSQATSQVVTISGTEDVPIALFDQAQTGAPLDFAIFKDLRSSYDAQLETMLLSGTGVNGQLLGLTNVVGINSISYAVTPAATTMFPFLGQMMAAIGNNRKIPPTAWLINTSRWAWISTSEDTATRPLGLSAYSESFPTGAIASIGVYLDDALPNTGSSTLQVPIIQCIPEDMMVFESDKHTDMMLEPLTGTLQVRFQLRRYVAALVGRYPTGISVMVGSGTISVSNF